MKTLLILAVVVTVAAAAPTLAPRLAPLVTLSQSSEPIPDEYIVVLDKMSDSDFGLMMTEVNNLVQSFNGTMMHEYTEAILGFSVRMGAEGVNQLRNMNAIQYIEPNQVMRASASCSLQTSTTWGLVRTNERALNIDGEYTYPENAGEGVDVYIVDTGIYTENSDFEGRAVWGTDTVDDPSPLTDDNGHGTHVAGTVMSKTWGMAKKATAIAVKVLGRNGSGSNAGVIAGVDWVLAQHKKKAGKRPSAANMSLGGGFSAALNAAVNAAVAGGVSFAVAAGNEDSDACSRSPASASDPVTVGSSDNQDSRSSFSNHGKCVDIFAPGSSITSTWIGSTTADNTISGTSMASPHVAGQMAKILSKDPSLSPSQVTAELMKSSTPNVLSNIKTGSPNNLLFGDCA